MCCRAEMLLGGWGSPLLGNVHANNWPTGRHVVHCTTRFATGRQYNTILQQVGLGWLKDCAGMPPGALPRAALAAPTLLARRRWAAKETSGSRAEIQTFLACIGIVHGNSWVAAPARQNNNAMEWNESEPGAQQWIDSIKRWRLRIGVQLPLF